eukprot:scaffold238727_cov33-Tisochrysis_lutea.AAC.2
MRLCWSQPRRSPIQPRCQPRVHTLQRPQECPADFPPDSKLHSRLIFYPTPVSMCPLQLEQLKRSLMQSEQENKALRAAAMRLDAQLRRAEREAEDAAAAGAIFEGGVASLGGMSRTDAHMVKGLKAQVRDLQRQLKDKDAAMAELSSSTKGSRLKELQVQARTYFNEARRLQALLDYSRQQKDGSLAVLQQAHQEEMAALQQQMQVLRSQSAALDDELGRCVATQGWRTPCRRVPCQLHPLPASSSIGGVHLALCRHLQDDTAGSSDEESL